MLYFLRLLRRFAPRNDTQCFVIASVSEAISKNYTYLSWQSTSHMGEIDG